MAREYLEPQEESRMEESAASFRDQLLVRVLYHLGCRISEALRIGPDNIDFAAGTVTIVHLKSRIRLHCHDCGASLGLKHEFCPKCGSKTQLTLKERSERRRQRSLPLDAPTLQMAKAFIEQGGPVLRDGRLCLFGINRHRAWQIVRECAKKAGLPTLVNPETGKPRGVSPHRLRDAFAVHAMKMDDSGEGMRLLQEHLGHSSFNTTAHYRKIASDEHRAWYEKLWNEAQDSSTSLKQ